MGDSTIDEEQFFFVSTDYAAFEPIRRRDELYNERRQMVRDKLIRLHALIYPEMRRRGWEVHPHWRKEWLISAWYLSPHVTSIPHLKLRYSKPEALVKRMEKLFLDDFGHFYAHAMMDVVISEQGLGVELSVPASAWVDGQNLRGKITNALEAPTFREKFGRALRRLDNRFRFQIEEYSEGDRNLVYARRARSVSNPPQIAAATAAYRPGAHDLRIVIWYVPHEPCLRKDTIREEVLARLEELYPLYHFIAWSPTNDYRRFAAR